MGFCMLGSAGSSAFVRKRLQMSQEKLEVKDEKHNTRKRQNRRGLALTSIVR
jgi:hypothetical protein